MLRYADIPYFNVCSVTSEYFVWESDCSSLSNEAFTPNNQLSTSQYE
jgi:hypothetical protein